MRCVIYVIGLHCSRQHLELKLSLDATKPVFAVSEKARLKPVSSATETS